MENKITYIAKTNSWFISGSTVISIFIDGEIGLFEGCIIDKHGNKIIDNEICRVDEFDILGDNENDYS